MKDDEEAAIAYALALDAARQLRYAMKPRSRSAAIMTRVGEGRAR